MNEMNFDLHCDLLYYLLRKNSKPDDRELGCSLPYLREGNVKLQVMAIYTATAKNSTAEGVRQSEVFADLLNTDDFFLFNPSNYEADENKDRAGVLASIENASSFCEEDSDLETGFKNLEAIINNTQKVLYIGLTHHTENRFGGGNNSGTGLKEDGKVVLDYISDRKIAIDLSHTSDQLAYDILNYIDQRSYHIPILASHSNYRTIYDKKRNLPDELAKEVIRRKGLIGLNFIRNCVDETDPYKLYEHLQYGLDLGGENSIAFGADFYYCKNYPDTSKLPIFFQEFENATAYEAINKKISENYSVELMEKISHKNALDFIKKL